MFGIIVSCILGGYISTKISKAKHDNQIYSGGKSNLYMYFGDSFIGMFKLIKNIQVYKFAGGTSRGLTKTTNENRQKIIEILKHKNPSCIVFQFGNVDLHFTYPYKILNGYSVDIETFINERIFEYVKFIDSLHAKTKIILCPYYSTISDQDLIASLQKYEIPIFQKTIPKSLTMKNRKKLVDMYNHKLKQESLKYENIYVIDINQDISKNGIIKDEYTTRKIDKLNIHLVWETTIKLYIKYLKNCGLNKENFKIDENKSYSDYVNYKINIMKLK